MKTVIVASTNPVKIAAVKDGFAAMFPDETYKCIGIESKSGVGNQPMSDAEAYKGAKNRVTFVQKSHPTADYLIGIEAGVEEKDGLMEAFAWIYILSKDGMVGQGKTGTFNLPKQVATLIKEGKELGEADDIVFQKTNSKQQMGAVGILTDNVIDRTKYYREAVILALIPFKHKEYYR